MEAQPADEIKRLQRCNNDLVSVLALPAIWSGGDSSHIVHTLLDALLNMLGLDLVYVRLKDSVDEAPIETIRFAPTLRLAKQLMPRSQEICGALSRRLGDDPKKWPPQLRTPIAGEDFSIVPVRLGLHGEIGVIAAASQRTDFPAQTEQLLLSVAANQASIGLQEAWLRNQQKRIARELDQRVAERTLELAEANEELRKEVADRRLVEEKLRREESERKRSEVRKAAIVDSALSCIVTIDHEGRITEFNPAAERTFGYRRDEVMGRSMADIIIPPSLRQKHREGFARYLANGEGRVLGKRVEMTAVRADGSEFPVELAIVRTPLDGPPAFTGYLRDLTDHKRNESALREAHAQVARSEERWRSVFENSAVGVALADMDGKFLATNPVYQQMLGYTEEELRELSFLDVTAEEYKERNRALVGELWAGKRQQFQMEKQYRRKNGSLLWVRNSLSLVPGTERVPQFLMALSEDITDRRRAEDALRDSEQSLRLILDGIAGLVAIMNARGEVEAVNRQVLDYFAKTTEEMKGWATSDAVHPDDLPAVMSAWKCSIETASMYNLEHRLRRADGVYRWFRARGLPLRDAKGRALRWYVLLTDIDEQKQAEEALLARERELNVIVNTVPALAWSARPDGSAEFFNQHYLAYVGLPLEKLQGSGWTVAVHRDDIASLFAAWQVMMAAGKPGEVEARLRRFDGEYRWFLFRANPMFDQSGNILKWYGTNTDIDDRKRAEEQLRRSEAFLTEGQKLSRIGSFSWLVATDAIKWSEQLYRIFEFEPAVPVTFELIGSRVHPEDLPLLYDMIAKAQRGVSDFEYEHRLLMPDRSIKYLHLIGHGTRDREGRQEYIGAVQDVTQRRLSEEALGKARSELANVARVTSLGVLTASIAHEVNQPLSGIVTNASTCLRMLSADPPNVEGARETARRAIRDGNRASDVITRLRTLYSKKDITLEPIDLNDATREVTSLSLSELHGNRVILRQELADDLPPVPGDRVQLQQVILNLLRNAADAMSAVDDRPRELLIKTECDEGERVRLSVKDAGVGLTPQAADKLFEAFFTTKSGGMGIGLSISRSIIEAHRGRLWATPNDGPGATFAFSIPCTRESNRADAETRVH
ncbi:MAG: PAS domain S-box protein [Terriglobales bacterium]